MIAPVPARPRRLAYLGNPEVAVPPLRALAGSAAALGIEVVAVVTSEPRRRGRRADPTPTPVAAVATEIGIDVVHDLDDLNGLGVDLGVVVAYGRLLSVQLLARIPMVNLHFSLLPRWRGAAPVERALLAGDTETGVCIMDLAEGLDTGGVRARTTTPIGPHETADDLRDRLADLAADLLVGWLDGLIADGPDEPEPQLGEPTWAHKLGRDDLRLDWGQPAAELHRLVRVGGAHTTYRGESLKVWAAEIVPQVGGSAGVTAPGVLVDDVVATSDGGLRLVKVQAAGRARMTFGAWSLGARPHPDERLGD